MLNTIFDKAVSGTTAVQGDKFIPITKGGRVSLQLITTDTIAGAWKILASNKPDATVNGDSEASDITAAFSKAGSTYTAIAAVLTGGSSQAVQAGPLYFNAINAVFTPTTGAGNSRAFENEMVSP